MCALLKLQFDVFFNTYIYINRERQNKLKTRERSLAKEMPAPKGIFDENQRQPFMPANLDKKMEKIRKV